MAQDHELVGYFGYGSLVNRATLRTQIVAAMPARLAGWRRVWLPRPNPGTDVAPPVRAQLEMGKTPALLSAVRADETAAIDGLLVIDYAQNLAAVDAREALYHRREIGLEALTFSDRGQGASAFDLPALKIPLYVYEARRELPASAGEPVILRSYLDAVMQGFLTEFGVAGVHRFVAETQAFHTVIHEDRHAPLYERPVAVSPQELALFDQALAQ